MSLPIRNMSMKVTDVYIESLQRHTFYQFSIDTCLP